MKRKKSIGILLFSSSTIFNGSFIIYEQSANIFPRAPSYLHSEIIHLILWLQLYIPTSGSFLMLQSCSSFIFSTLFHLFFLQVFDFEIIIDHISIIYTKLFFKSQYILHCLSTLMPLEYYIIFLTLFCIFAWPFLHL